MLKLKQIFRNVDRSNGIKEYKIILLWTTFFGSRLWWFTEGNQTFIQGKCEEYRCIITSDRKFENKSSAIMFHMRNLGANSILPKRNYNQHWIFVIYESPIHTYNVGLPRYRYAFNKTFTYRTDSDFYDPYGHVVTKHNITSTVVPPDARKRTKLILWYVSNCAPKTRMTYAKELSKYVRVDIFGRCGKADPCRETKCVKATKLKYKFYLAFESGRCKDYITEKFWQSLRDGVVPIAFGPRMADYEKVAPPHSFIHVDNFTSPKQLGDYIKYLDKNDQAYYKYHMWRNKHDVIGSFKETDFKALCKLCSELHKTTYAQNYRDIAEFWSRKHCF